LGGPEVIAVVAASHYQIQAQIVLEKIQRVPGLETSETRILVEV
jgi:hypothetical protein